MKQVVLTIDDIPQKITPKMIDYLTENGIPAVMFAVGEKIEEGMDTLVYALKKGIIIGNHSFTHPAFSSLSFEECVEEIEKTDLLLEKAYKLAGVPRIYKAFRFPYIDKGGDKKEKLQEYLKANGYMKICDNDVTDENYIETHKNDLDVACSFDIQEYNIPNGLMTIDDVMKHLKDYLYGNAADQTADQNGSDSFDIVLFHSHDDTERVVPDYYKLILGEMLKAKVKFVSAKWQKFS